MYTRVDEESSSPGFEVPHFQKQILSGTQNQQTFHLGEENKRKAETYISLVLV